MANPTEHEDDVEAAELGPEFDPAPPPRDDPFAEPGRAAPRLAYRAALERYDGARLVAVARAIEADDTPNGRTRLAATITDRLAEPRAAERVLGGLPHDARLALTLFAVTETTRWAGRGLALALRCLGVDPVSAVGPLLDHGLLSVNAPEVVLDPLILPAFLEGEVEFFAHPSAVSASRTVRPESGVLPATGPVRQVREADGLEPILRLAVVWQRVGEAPLRQTQQGTLYKRDRDRIEDDPVLAGPIADALEPLPDMPAFWLSLAKGVGLLVSEPGGERVAAAPTGFWSDNAYHLAQMVAARWLALRTWHEQGGVQREGAVFPLALPHVRPAVLLWLATLGDDDWVTTDDLAAALRARVPGWSQAAFVSGDEPPPPPPPTSPTHGRAPKAKKAGAPAEPTDLATLEAILLGAGYQLGLVRTAEESSTGRRAVQLTPLGRYVLAVGPPPSARPTYDHFLFVQPSFEVIAYRQGLTPSLVGQFSRFARWSQVGAALALRLTPESVYRGLEGGMTPAAMLDLLGRHSGRALPSGISEALRSWAERRERVTYHGSATLVEFASAADLDRALSTWPDGPGAPPVRVSDRLILVEDEASIPWTRFRKTGSRNYREAPEACVGVEPDGVTLTLDLARSDLLVDAELARFADEEADQPPDRPSSSTNPRRRFAVTAESLGRSSATGMTAAQLSAWFVRRTGAELPPAVRLLLHSLSEKAAPLSTTRPLILHAPTPEVLDGLAQHPGTRPYLGDRLGPTAVVIPDELLGPFRKALEDLGLALDDPDAPRADPTARSRPKPR